MNVLTVPPLPVPALPGAWQATTQARTRWAAVLRLRVDGHEVRVRVERCAAGRLRDSYPVGARDVEIQILDGGSRGLPAGVLRALTDTTLALDPLCRRVVYAAPAGDHDRIVVAETAGFRYVVDVDLGPEEVSLFVAEPDWASGDDVDHDRVPGS